MDKTGKYTNADETGALAVCSDDEKVKSFVEEYNKRMDWDKDILEGFDLSLLSDEVRDFLGRYISGYDLKRARCYEYEDDGTLELQAFNNETYGMSYFWIRPVGDENEYKEERKNIIRREIGKELEKIIPELKKITEKKEDLEKILSFICL